MNKKFFIFLILIVLIILVVLISKNMIKNSKIGNNMSSQEIVDKILNINSYVAEIEVQVNSNKNQNKYIISQEYNTENGTTQVVLEPANIEGVKITKKDSKLTIENTELKLQQIFENYEELENNDLDLYVFLNEYKEIDNPSFEEKDEKIIMKLPNKMLYINKDNGLPEKLLVQDNNQNTTIIIKYNKIELK